MVMAGLAGAAIGSAAQVGMGLYNAHHNASEARAADARQYRYMLKSAKQLPLAQRQGLESAGYNPMLALGNIGGSSAMASHQGNTNLSFDGSSAKALGEFAENLIKDKAQAEVDNIKADTDLKKGQLEAAESQRLQTEANTALINSQTERSDLAYGRDIADTVTGIAGTGAQLYSAKSMADVARQNAFTNSRNASVNERRANSTTFEVHRDGKGKKVGEIQRSVRSSGVPTVSSSANGAKPNASGALGSSAKAVGSIAKQVAKELLFLAPAAVGAYGVGKLQESADRAIKSDSRSNYGKGYKHFVPRLGL